MTAAGTRRDALRAAGGVALAASAAPLLLGVRDAFAAAAGDEGTMLAAVRLEQALVVAYRTLQGSPALDARAVSLARRFGDQEQQHLAAVTKQLQNLGGVMPAEPAPAMVKAGRRAVTDLHTQPALLAFAGALEANAIAAYYEAQQSLQRDSFLQVTAAIMASEGQHLALLREALRRPPVPHAFETGRP
ncbi:MAG TPA: ferritin-like domain-containing protein [Solirubrobacteraceae bacterium]|nr:ferritin-like domain-containing protein [Solirubrobacteraceae bacterium]